MQSTYQPRSGLWQRLLYRLGITTATVVKVYNGFGHAQQVQVFGHVLLQSPLPRRKWRESILRNTWALLRLFITKPAPAGWELKGEWQGLTCTTTTDAAGFFKMEWKGGPEVAPGWHEVTVTLTSGEAGLTGKGKVMIPHRTQHAFVSDVDDTFLVSHSAHLRKRLWVLFTENARSREPFDGSVKHYQLLSQGNTTSDKPNPFFYVSSSEWNLYDYLNEFVRVQELPQGVYLLNVLKQFSQIFKTGQNNHGTKFTRIVRIIDAYPQQKFVLLGDSSQHDPYIYESLVKHFPQQIAAVYIRDVYKKNYDKVKTVLQGIASKGVPICFFSHSNEAIEHSKSIGLITDAAATGPQPTEAINAQHTAAGVA